MVPYGRYLGIYCNTRMAHLLSRDSLTIGDNSIPCPEDSSIPVDGKLVAITTGPFVWAGVVYTELLISPFRAQHDLYRLARDYLVLTTVMFISTILSCTVQHEGVILFVLLVVFFFAGVTGTYACPMTLSQLEHRYART